MTGRIILGVVLALILLFLFSNVRLVFRYDNGEIFLQARWLFIRYQILPEPEKRKKKGAGKTKKKKAQTGRPAGQGSALEREKAERDNQNPHGKKQESQSNSPKTPGGRTGAGTAKDSVGELSQKGKETEKKAGVRMADQESRTLQATIEQVLDLLRAAKKPLKLLYRHLWVRRLDFRLVVAREDAAQTAIALWPDEWLGSWRLRCHQSVCPDEKGACTDTGGLFVPAGPSAGILCVNAAGSFSLAAGIQFVARFLWKTLKNSRAAGDAALTSSAKAAQQRKREGKRDKEENSCPN